MRQGADFRAGSAILLTQEAFSMAPATALCIAIREDETMHNRLFRTLRVTIATLATLILMSALASNASAQSVKCVDAPALSLFDGNGDGVLTIGEIQAAAPDNAELQGLAGQLSAKGISGIQYTGGCSGSDAGTTPGGTGSGTTPGGTGAGTTPGGTDSGTTPGTGSTNGTTPGTGSANGATTTTTGGTGDGTAAGGSTSGSTSVTGNGITTATGVYVGSLPNTGDGYTSDSSMPAFVVMFAMASMLALACAFALRRSSES